jgi:hypothetical protein
MPLDPAAQQLTSPAGSPTLSACAALDAVVDGQDPGPLSAAPTQNTVECVDGKFDAGKSTWTFELASLATNWAAGSPPNGVVIRPKPGDATQFNYAFLGKKDIKVVASYMTAAAPVAVAPAAPTVDTGVAPAPDTGFTSGPPPVAPVTSVTAPVTAPQPQVMAPAAPVVAAPVTAPVAAIKVDSLRPSGTFWLALLGLGVLVMLLGLVLGDPMDPVVVDARRRRFAEVIRARAAARVAASSTTGRPAAAPRARPA